jgi:CPA2 family monovalent cation:H+ antiporter-2
MFAKVLETYKVPKNVIYELLENLRSKHYRAFRNVQDLKFELLEGLEFLKGENIQNFLVKKGYRLAGKSIKELGLRSKTGVTIIAIKRGPEFLINPSPEEKIEEGDVLILIGKEEDLAKAQAYLKEFEP